MTNAIADAPPMHGEAVRRASGFVLVFPERGISLGGSAERSLPSPAHPTPHRERAPLAALRAWRGNRLSTRDGDQPGACRTRAVEIQPVPQRFA